MKIYIAGPMTGLPDFNYDSFDCIANQLRFWGFEVENPADSFDRRTDLPRELYIKEAIRKLITCDAITFSAFAIISRGARLEADIAAQCGIPVFNRDLYDGDHAWDSLQPIENYLQTYENKNGKIFYFSTPSVESNLRTRLERT